MVGSYGWVDANGVLRIYDYVADDAGYRITNNRAYEVEVNGGHGRGQNEAANSISDDLPLPVIRGQKSGISFYLQGLQV